jgi:hypothetical protein
LEAGKDPKAEIRFTRRKKTKNKDFLHLSSVPAISTLLEINFMSNGKNHQQMNSGGPFGAIDLKMENEILKLKMQAESGAIFCSNDQIPPEIENILLNRIQATEAAFANAQFIPIGELVGDPVILPSYLLEPSELTVELQRIMQLINNHGVYVYFRGVYSEKLIYDFIANELFQLETEDIDLPGYIRTFVYEEFHPEHKITLQEVASGFLEHWLERRYEYFDFTVTDIFVTNKGHIKTKYEVLKKIEATFNSCSEFTNASFYFSQCDFHWDESENMGTGHAEGHISYDARSHQGNLVHHEGAFKFYFTHEDNGWEIFYFILPGFQW